MRIGAKATILASRDFARAFEKLSKQALIDILYCACQLGTNDSEGEILTQAARNAQIALAHRMDRIPREISQAAAQRIDSDPDAVENESE